MSEPVVFKVFLGWAGAPVDVVAHSAIGALALLLAERLDDANPLTARGAPAAVRDAGGGEHRFTFSCGRTHAQGLTLHIEARP
jgi:hypothetical protein